jgi:hypothetical protein
VGTIRSLRAKIELVEIEVEKGVLDGRISTGSILLEPNGGCDVGP